MTSSTSIVWFHWSSVGDSEEEVLKKSHPQPAEEADKNLQQKKAIIFLLFPTQLM